MILAGVLSIAMAVIGQAHASAVTCRNIPAEACERVVLPGIKAGLSSELANYDLSSMSFTDFGCEKGSPLKPKPGHDILKLHVIYDACKRRVRIDRDPTDVLGPPGALH